MISSIAVYGMYCLLQASKYHLNFSRNVIFNIIIFYYAAVLIGGIKSFDSSFVRLFVCPSVPGEEKRFCLSARLDKNTYSVHLQKLFAE